MTSVVKQRWKIGRGRDTSDFRLCLTDGRLLLHTTEDGGTEDRMSLTDDGGLETDFGLRPIDDQVLSFFTNLKIVN